ncbi:hypothetical protein SAMN05216315_13525 [Nitrosospira sp. Nsp18]|nr:hypothetical protein SAMN05216315_13525 [Nitrosospira sp. Nsp18]
MFFLRLDGLRIGRGFKGRLGQAVNIAIEEVAEISLEKSSKFHYVVSKVRAKLH